MPLKTVPPLTNATHSRALSSPVTPSRAASRGIAASIALLLFFLGGTCGALVSTGGAPAGPRLALQSLTLDPTPLSEDPNGLDFLTEGIQTALLQFIGPVQEAWKTSVVGSGIRLLH